MQVEFVGAVGGDVTGSRHIVHTEKARVLLDCGLFQGPAEFRRSNWKKLPFPANQLRSAILTHAHIDHSGYLPRLVRQGFSGPVGLEGVRLLADPSVMEVPVAGMLDPGYLDTRRALIGMGAPVCGFRPMRSFLARTTKFPNPEILIFSPSARTSFIVSKTASTTSAASFFEKPPTFSYTASMISAFVIQLQPPEAPVGAENHKSV